MEKAESCMDIDKIKCPRCGEFFPVNEAITYQLSDQIKKEVRKKFSEQARTMQLKLKEVEKEKANIIKAKEALNQ